MNLIVTLFTVLFSFIITPAFSARILGIVPTPSYSHQVVFRPLWRELSLRGHQLTVLTTDPMNDPLLTNLTEIDLHFSYKIWNRRMNMNDMAQKGTLELFETTVGFSYDFIDEQLQYSEVQTLIKNETEQFDLLIVEGLFTTMYAFSERFKCPFIQITSLDAPAENYHSIGNPSHPVLNPDFMLPFTDKLTFIDRLVTTGFSLFLKWFKETRTYPTQQLLIYKHFGNNYPHLRDMERNASMMFVNTDVVFHQIRPLLPNIIQIGGGTHMTLPKPLPKDLKKLLDDASQGFIYFSLGSNVKSKFLSENIRNILLKTFAELPYLVLWKFELEDLSGKPENVIISKWFPQQDIFRHPNIKLFISQGGLQSMEEAIYNHIPIIGMPFVADQITNVKRIVSKGLGLSIEYTALDETDLKNIILEVVNNPKYRNTVRELAELAQDQPMTGLQRAVWWTEYVLRHKGAKHLRSPAMDLPLYQYFLLDVISFCLLVILVICYVLIKLIKIFFKLVKYFVVTPKLKVQ